MPSNATWTSGNALLAKPRVLLATQVARRRKGVLWLGWETGSGSHTVGTHAPGEGVRHWGPCPRAMLGSTCIAEPQHHSLLPTCRPLLAPGPTRSPEAIQNVHMLHVPNPHQQDPAAQQLLTRAWTAHGKACRMAASTLDATTSGGDSVVSMVSCGPGIRASSRMWVSAVIATVSTVVPVRGLPRRPTSRPEQVSTTVRSGRRRAASSAR